MSKCHTSDVVRNAFRCLVFTLIVFATSSSFQATENLTPVASPDPFSGMVAGKRGNFSSTPADVRVRRVSPSATPPPRFVLPRESKSSGSAESLFKLSVMPTAREVSVGGRIPEPRNQLRSYSCGSSQVATQAEASSSKEKDDTKSQTPGRDYDDWVASIEVKELDEEVEIPPEMRLVRIPNAEVQIDGHLDDAAWNRMSGFERMVVIEPDTLDEPEYKTCIRIFHTDEGLYVSADMVQPADTLVHRLSARDQDLNRDGFGITIDTSGKGLFGFWFAINLGGSMEDGKVLPERSFSREWDGAWHGATAVTKSGWSAEMFIPWSIIAMPPSEAERRMSFFANRKVAHKNERYGWPALPFTKARFMSAMQPIAMSEVNPKQQWALFPYAATTSDGIHEENAGKVGVNFSWRPAGNMQVTGTVNPDFGAVESDDVVVNLTAFETYFPEKRLFFLEGSEVFNTSPRSNTSRMSSRGSGARSAPSTWNPEPTTMLNTRRIGGSAKDVDIPDDVSVDGPELSRPTDLLGAVKLVGQSSDFRYGFLGAMENDVELRGTLDETGEDVIVTSSGRDFGVARVVWERQSGTGRQAHGYMGTFADSPSYQALVHGIDSHFLTQNGRWTIDTQLLNSNVDSELGYGAFADIRYTPKQGVTHRISMDFLDDTLDISDLGFLRRNNVQGMRYTRFHNTSRGLPGFVRSRSLGLFSAFQTNDEGEVINGYAGFGLSYFFKNQGLINLQTSYRPQLVDDRSSYGEGSYETEPGWYMVVTYGSDAAKRFAYSVQGGIRTDELGDHAQLADIGFTLTPMNRLNLDFDIRFRHSPGWVLYDGDRNFNRYTSDQLSYLFSMDYFITAKQQIRATMQWTGVSAHERDFWQLPDEVGSLVVRDRDPMAESSDFTISRLTAQLRYRWEIAPMSDFFLVYTRGANVAELESHEFDKLFKEALKEPIVDLWVMKLRYRFGS